MSAAMSPGSLVTAWAVEPAVAVGLAGLVWLWARGRAVARPVRGRTAAFAAAVAVLVVALVSPLDALSAAFVSAHMVQHLLLALVAAPLLVAAASGTTLTRGLPPRLRRTAGRASGLARRRAGGGPVAAFAAVGAYVGVWSAWHVPALYRAAVTDPVVHALEHATLLGAGVAFWTVVLRSRRRDAWRGLLALFAATLHGGVLAALLVFAPAPLYSDAVAAGAGLDPRADQQLAGVLMWVPGGFVLLAAAARLVIGWVSADAEDPVTTAAPPLRPPTTATATTATAGRHRAD